MVYFLYPETRGLSLEQIDHIFEGKGHGVSAFTQGVFESIKGPAAIEVPPSAAQHHHMQAVNGNAQDREKGVPMAVNVEYANS